MGVESVVEAGRRLVGTSLLDTCTIRRRTVVTDTGGGQGESWVALYAAVACRFGTIVDPDPTMVIDSIYGPPTAMALLPLGTDVRRGDILLNESTDRIWLVVGIKTPDSTLAVVERVLIREV